MFGIRIRVSLCYFKQNYHDLVNLHVHITMMTVEKVLPCVKDRVSCLFNLTQYNNNVTEVIKDLLSGIHGIYVHVGYSPSLV